MKKLFLLPFLLVIAPCAYAGNQNFLDAKRNLNEIYQKAEKDQLSTLYCGCRMNISSGRLTLSDHASCGYRIRDDEERAGRIEWEHVVPAYTLGGKMDCWQEGGREECRSNASFAKMEGDMHNLFPVIGEVNKDRGSYKYEIWDAKSADEESEESQIIKIVKLIINFIVEFLKSVGNPEDAATVELYGNKAVDFIEDILKTRQAQNSQEAKSTQSADAQVQNGLYTYGGCEILIDPENRRVQPPKRSRGTVARAYLYMADTYGIRLSDRETEMYREWSRKYPADGWECRRNSLIAEYQGNDNPYITRQCAGSRK